MGLDQLPVPGEDGVPPVALISDPEAPTAVEGPTVWRRELARTASASADGANVPASHVEDSHFSRLAIEDEDFTSFRPECDIVDAAERLNGVTIQGTDSYDRLKLPTRGLVPDTLDRIVDYYGPRREGIDLSCPRPRIGGFGTPVK